MLKPWRVWPVAGRIHAIVDGDAQTRVRAFQTVVRSRSLWRVQTRPLSLEDVSVLLTAVGHGQNDGLRRPRLQCDEPSHKSGKSWIRCVTTWRSSSVSVLALYSDLRGRLSLSGSIRFDRRRPDLDRTPLSQLYEEGIRAALSYDHHWPRASVTSRCWIELKRAVRW